jgi:hypothetical protein
MTENEYVDAFNDNDYAKINGKVEFDWGLTCYYLHGQLHRLNGPARIWEDGGKEWWMHGKLHRLDGPAVEPPYGNPTSWFVDGKRIMCSSQEEFEHLLKLKAFW